MADSTHTLDRRRRSPGLLVALVSTAVLAFACGWSPAPARADGDPASDVLASQSLFLPQDGGIPAAAQVRLSALLASAQRSGYPIRVALIATQADLGSVTELWRRPQSYAGFLGQELSLIYTGTLLVVMPDGYGVYRAGESPAPDRAALDAAPTPGSGALLGGAALTAVRRLAGVAGHRLTPTTGSAPPAADSSAASDSDGLVTWVALAFGTALILLAWTASLRARPARFPRRRRNRVA